MTYDEVLGKVYKIVAKFLEESDNGNIIYKKDFHVDSLDIIEIILNLEKEFNVIVKDEEWDMLSSQRQNLNIEKLAQFVCSKKTTDQKITMLGCDILKLQQDMRYREMFLNRKYPTR